MRPLRSRFILVAELAVSVWVIINYGNVSEPLRTWVLLGLAAITSAILLAPYPNGAARLALAIYCVFLVTVTYLSYLGREMVIASVGLTLLVTAATYIRIVKEIMRRKHG